MAAERAGTPSADSVVIGPTSSASLPAPRLLRSSWVLIFMCFAAALIARSAGSGWAVVILAGILATLAVAAVTSLVSLVRADIQVDGPRDATVGCRATMDLFLRSHTIGTQARFTEPAGEWMLADGPCRGEATVAPGRRGIFDKVELEIRCAAPLGLIRWSRRIRAGLPNVMEVGPAPLSVAFPEAVLSGAAGEDESLRGRSGDELIRSVRAYVHGDPARFVHWASTARRGDLMVKEMEQPDRPEFVLIVDLRGPYEESEAAASRAAGIATEALRAGIRTTMITAERLGGVVGVVSTHIEVGRRLARAVATGQPPAGPIPAGSLVVRVGVERSAETAS